MKAVSTPTVIVEIGASVGIEFVFPTLTRNVISIRWYCFYSIRYNSNLHKIVMNTYCVLRTGRIRPIRQRLDALLWFFLQFCCSCCCTCFSCSLFSLCFSLDNPFRCGTRICCEMFTTIRLLNTFFTSQNYHFFLFMVKTLKTYSPSTFKYTL